MSAVAASPVIYVVDDDAAVRDGLDQLLSGSGFEVRPCADADRFFAACDPARPGCVLLDVAMPGMSGPALQESLAQRGIALPVVFLTAHGDVPTSVRAMKAGALDFLEKPVAGETLLAVVRSALAQHEHHRAEHTARTTARARYAKLTAREREVMTLAVAGLANKEIARKLGLSHRTVEIHRARAMRKMHASTLLELARAAELCGAAPASVASVEEDKPA